MLVVVVMTCNFGTDSKKKKVDALSVITDSNLPKEAEEENFEGKRNLEPNRPKKAHEENFFR